MNDKDDNANNDTDKDDTDNNSDDKSSAGQTLPPPKGRK
jgi:hypothetical protein